MSEVISDPLGREWWNQKFKGASSVDLVEFCKAFEDHFSKEDKIKILHISALVIDIDGNDNVKDREFGNFLLRFGPFDQCVARATANLIAQDGTFHAWYHGATARDEAGTLLGKSKATSSFLIRFSDSKPDKLALAYTRVKEGKVEVKNMLIDCIPSKDGGGFIIPDHTQKADTLVQLVDSYNQHLKHPVPHTKEFEARFNLIKENGYEKLRKADCKSELDKVRGSSHYGPVSGDGEHKGGSYVPMSGDGHDPKSGSGNYTPVHGGGGGGGHGGGHGGGGAYAPLDTSANKDQGHGGAYAPLEPKH